MESRFWKIVKWILFLGIIAGIFNLIYDGELSHHIIFLPFMCFMMWYSYFAEHSFCETTEKKL